MRELAPLDEDTFLLRDHWSAIVAYANGGDRRLLQAEMARWNELQRHLGEHESLQQMTQVWQALTWRNAYGELSPYVEIEHGIIRHHYPTRYVLDVESIANIECVRWTDTYRSPSMSLFLETGDRGFRELDFSLHPVPVTQKFSDASTPSIATLQEEDLCPTAKNTDFFQPHFHRQGFFYAEDLFESLKPGRLARIGDNWNIYHDEATVSGDRLIRRVAHIREGVYVNVYTIEYIRFARIGDRFLRYPKARTVEALLAQYDTISTPRTRANQKSIHQVTSSKQRQEIKSLLKRMSLDKVRQACELISSLDEDEEVWRHYGVGCGILEDGQLTIGARIAKHVYEKHHAYVTLYFLKHSGLLQQQKHLDLSHQHTLQSIDVLQDCLHLEELDLGGVSDVKDISPIAKMTKLRKLSLSPQEGLMNLRLLSGLRQLTSFTLINEKIASLDGLSCQDTLQEFCLAGGDSLQDSQALREMKRLRKVDIYNCSSRILDDLSSVTSLEHLTFYAGPPVTDLRSLSRLTGLNGLRLSRGTDLHLFEPLSSLRQLESISLSTFQSTDGISAMSTLTGLRSIYFTAIANPIHIPALVEAFQLLPALCELGFGTVTFVGDLMAFAELQQLESLYFDEIANIDDETVQQLRMAMPTCTVGDPLL
ncbi:MAG: hypothetical protein AAFV53_37585 [Myxococcota bacterium]